MEVAFAGTPAFAADVLAALIAAGFRVPLVLTQPDRPVGRGQRVAAPPVKQLALEHGIAVTQHARLGDPATQARIAETRADVLAVAAYGLIVPGAVLAWPRHGCINVHASLLPRWRGAAPIARALLAGDPETGVTIMRMDAGLDTGPMLEAVRVPIGSRDTRGSLEAKLARIGADALIGVLRRFERGDSIAGVAQPGEGVSYAPKIEKREAVIDWSLDARAIDRQIRAFDPSPGAQTTLDGNPLKVWRAEPVGEAPRPGAAPGALVGFERGSFVIACGVGALRVDEVQPAAGRRMPASAFAAGRRLAVAMRFGP